MDLAFQIRNERGISCEMFCSGGCSRTLENDQLAQIRVDTERNNIS